MGSGRFIVIEGVEGAGKTTQVGRLAHWLGERGIAHRAGREPGGTKLGERIRDILLSGADGVVPDRTELLLLLAARTVFVEQIVRPALERGLVVISDRYDLSTLAYQAFGRGLDLAEVRRLNAFATGGLRADLSCVLDVDVDEGLARGAAAGRSPDRIEATGRAFLARVRDGYLRLAENDDAVVVVDGRGSPADVHARIVQILADRFPETFGGSAG